MDTVLQTKRLTLELINRTHVEAVFHLYSHPEVCRYFDTDPIEDRQEAVEQVERWIKFHNENRQIRFAIKLGAKFIGTCGVYLMNYRHKRASLGYDLHPDFWGNGYMTEALTGMLDYIQETYQFKRIQATVMPENKASLTVLEKLGFHSEGLLKAYEVWGSKGHVDLILLSKIY